MTVCTIAMSRASAGGITAVRGSLPLSDLAGGTSFFTSVLMPLVGLRVDSGQSLGCGTVQLCDVISTNSHWHYFYLPHASTIGPLAEADCRIPGFSASRNPSCYMFDVQNQLDCQLNFSLKAGPCLRRGSLKRCGNARRRLAEDWRRQTC